MGMFLAIVAAIVFACVLGELLRRHDEAENARQRGYHDNGRSISFDTAKAEVASVSAEELAESEED